MGFRIRTVYNSQPPASNTTLHTADANVQTRITGCSITNDTTTSVTMTFHIVPSGQSVGDAYIRLNAKTLGPRETYTCPELVGLDMAPLSILNGIPSAANQVSVQVDVAEIW